MTGSELAATKLYSTQDYLSFSEGALNWAVGGRVAREAPGNPLPNIGLSITRNG
jgi:hypothetical protein